MTVTDEVRRVVEPILEGRGLELYDLELAGRTLRVLVDRQGGVDIDTLGHLTREVSAALDERDPVPGGRYTLEVSSPGLERPLRRPDHFRKAVGTRIAVKTTPADEGDRRVDGELSAADDDGITVALSTGGERRLSYDSIERARTVFEWGPAPAPGRNQRLRRGPQDKSTKRASTS